MRSRVTNRVSLLLGVIGLSACGAVASAPAPHPGPPPASRGEGGGTVEIADVRGGGTDVATPRSGATTTAASPRSSAPFEDFISDADRERARRVERAGSGDDPFKPSGVWLPPFYYADAQHSIEWIGGLYLQLTDFENGTRTRILPPIFLQLQRPESRTLVTPLMGWRTDADGTSGYVGPYAYGRNRLSDHDVVFPFFWWFRERDMEDGPDARSYGAFAPFLFWQRDTSGKHRTFAPPLLWSWGDSKETTTLAANVYYHSEPGRSDFGAIPFYFGGRDEKGGYDIALPFFIRSTDANGTAAFALNTYYESRPDGYSLVSFPFLFAGRTGDESHTVVPPLFWRFQDRNESSWLLGPAYHHEEAGGSSTGIFPLWFSSDISGRRSDWILPPLFHRASDEKAGTSSLYCLNTYYGSWRDGYSLFSFPFLFAGRTGDDARVFAPPLTFYRDSNDKENTSSTYLLNTYYASRPDGYTFFSFPLLFMGRTGDESHVVAPPLFWSFGSKDSSTTVLGPAYRHVDEEGSNTGVFPLWFSSSTETGRSDLLPPLLFYRSSDEKAGTSSTYLLNSYYGSRKDGYTFFSFPFLFTGRSGDESHAVAPPLFWSFADKDSSTWVLGPGYRHVDKEGSNTGIFPLWFSGSTETTRHDFLPPLLFYRSTDDEAGTSSTYLLNSYYGSRKDGYTFFSFPFLFMGRTGDESHAVAPPLFWSWADKDSSTWIHGPGYRHVDPTGSNTGVFPLWFSSSTETTRHDFLPPLLFYRSSDDRTGTSSTWFLNTYYGSRKDGYTFNSFPLIFMGRTGEESHAVVPPIFWSWWNETSSDWILGPAYRHVTPRESSTGVFPLWFARSTETSRRDFVPPLLFYRSTDDKAETSSTYFLNTYYGSSPYGYTFFSFPFAWSWGDGSESTTIAGPAYRHEDEAGSSTGVFPLWFSSSTGTSRSDLVPPLLFYRSSDEKAGTSSTFLLNTYYGSRPDGSTFASVPLAYAKTEGKEHTVLVPPALTYHSGDGETEKTVVANTYIRLSPTGWSFAFAPLFFLGSEEKESHAVAFPVFWHFEDEKESTTIALNLFWHTAGDRRDLWIAPLYISGHSPADSYDIVLPFFWHFADATTSTTIAPPFFYRSEGDDWAAGLAPLWFSGRHEDGTGYDVAFPLLWRFESPDSDRLALLPFFDWARDRTRVRLVTPLFYHHEDWIDRTETTVALGLYWSLHGPTSSTRVLFPFFWDFDNRDTKHELSTVFPFFWRYDRPEETTSILLNTAWSSGHTPDGATWSFHLFPFVDLGSDSPDHFRWQVLGGFLGRESKGSLHRWRFAYVWTDPSS